MAEYGLLQKEEMLRKAGVYDVLLSLPSLSRVKDFVTSERDKDVPKCEFNPLHTYSFWSRYQMALSVQIPEVQVSLSGLC